MRFERWLVFPLSLLALACGPIGPISGGALRGTVHDSAPVSLESIANEKTIQLETRPSDPHSINIWCGVHEGRLYIPTSLIHGSGDPMEREWVRNVLADPDVRVRIDGNIYPFRAVRVTDERELEAVRSQLLVKYDVDPDEHVARGWIFRLEQH